MDITKLLVLLADGQTHSGERIGAQAGLTRAAVWKQIKKLEAWGLRVAAESGQGYRLSRPIELFSAEDLHAQISAQEEFEFDCIDVFIEAESTNRFLLDNPPARNGALRLCLAEWQSAGRGRRERIWTSPLGSGVCLSAGWTYDGTPKNFSALSLAAGAAIADVIAEVCGVSVQLKWPNDIVWDNRKLAGILVESRIESHGRCHVVIGVGINLDVSDEELGQLSDWSAGAVDLRSAMGGNGPGRNAFAAKLACRLGALLAAFENGQSDVWLESWRQLDYLNGKPVSITTSDAPLEGRANGIDDDGALLVTDESGVTQRVVAGDARVRMQ